MREIFNNGEFFCDRCMNLVTKHINIEKLLAQQKPTPQVVIQQQPPPPPPIPQIQPIEFEIPESLKKLEEITQSNSFGKLTNILQDLCNNQAFLNQKFQEKIIEEKFMIVVQDLKICQSN